jgi:hypothetical protein
VTPLLAIEDVLAPAPDAAVVHLAGEVALVPLRLGLEHLGDEPVLLSATARAVWELLDGRRSLADVAHELAGRYREDPARVGDDVRGVAGDLFERGLLRAASPQQPAVEP